MKKRNIGNGAAIALTFGLLLTGCSATPEAPAPAPTTAAAVETPKATESTKLDASESPMTEAEETAEAKEIAKKQESNPLGIDIKEAIDQFGSPEIKAAGKSKEINVEKAVHTGLSVYQDMTYTKEFYKARDASKDFVLINVDKFTDRMDADAIASAEQGIKKSGQFKGVFTTDSKAKFTYDDNGKKRSYTVTQIPSNKFDLPAISLTDAGTVSIAGWQYMTVPTKSETLRLKMVYNLEVTEAGSGDFIVNHISWSLEGVENVGN